MPFLNDKRHLSKTKNFRNNLPKVKHAKFYESPEEGWKKCLCEIIT